MNANRKKIRVYLKENIKELMTKPQNVAVFIEKTGKSHYTLQSWFYRKSDKLTNYENLLVFSEILNMPIEELITIEKE